MMIFHSYVSLPEGKWRFQICLVIQNFSRKNYGKWLTADFPCLFVCLLEARACNKQHCPANSSILQEYLYIYIHIIYIHYIYMSIYLITHSMVTTLPRTMAIARTNCTAPWQVQSFMMQQHEILWQAGSISPVGGRIFLRMCITIIKWVINIGFDTTYDSDAHSNTNSWTHHYE